MTKRLLSRLLVVLTVDLDVDGDHRRRPSRVPRPAAAAVAVAGYFERRVALEAIKQMVITTHVHGPEILRQRLDALVHILFGLRWPLSRRGEEGVSALSA